MAKLNVLKSQSVSSSKSDRSGRKHSNLGVEQKKTQSLRASAKSFVPPMSLREQGSVHERLESGARPKETMVKQWVFSQPQPVGQHLSRCQTVEWRSQGSVLNSHDESNDEEQNNILGIMSKQNEITTLLLKQQCLSSLPKKDLNVFDGDPLQYHAFMRAFKNSVESKIDNNSDCLYYLEQYTVGFPRDLIQSCQHIEPQRGYIRAKTLLQEHFGNEQKITYAYMNKALIGS